MYSEHRGLWNDLSCHAMRYFVCNAQTSIQRMDFDKREELIAKRLTRHKLRWQAYQTEAYRRKIRKQFFDRMREHMRQVRKHQQKVQQRQREYMRQMAFSRMMNRMGQRTSSMGLGMNFGGYGNTGGGINMGYGGSYGGGFRANSIFGGDNELKRRRLRNIIENSDNEMRVKIDSMKDKHNKLKERERDKRDFRKLDENEMFEKEEIHRKNMDFKNWRQYSIENEYVNPSPKRCVLFTTDNNQKLYELCLNDNHVFVTNYVKKIRKPHISDYLEEDIEYINHIKSLKTGNKSQSIEPIDNNDTIVLDGDMMDFEKYQNDKYMEAILVDHNQENANNNSVKHDDDKNIEIKRMGRSTNVFRIDEFLYNFEDNHRKQCYLERYPYRLCLECLELYDDTDTKTKDEIILYYGIQDSYIKEIQFNDNAVSFDDDNQWNEINQIITNDEIIEIKKCLMYGDAQFCLIKYNRNQNDNNNNHNEYRGIIITKLKENEEESGESNPSDFAFFQ